MLFHIKGSISKGFRFHKGFILDETITLRWHFLEQDPRNLANRGCGPVAQSGEVPWLQWRIAIPPCLEIYVLYSKSTAPVPPVGAGEVDLREFILFSRVHTLKSNHNHRSK